jgi:hypothetical protein
MAPCFSSCNTKLTSILSCTSQLNEKGIAMRDTFANFAALLLAAPQVPYYSAEPAAAPARPQVIAAELVWRCGAAGCIAGKSGARPVVDCEGLVRAVGRVKSFAVAGAPIAPEQLEKCNARAR